MSRPFFLPFLIMVAVFAHLLPAQDQESATPAETEDALYRVTGRVVDDVTGAPLSGATVTLQTVVMRLHCSDCDSSQPAAESEPARKTVTGSDGRFSFDNVPANNINVSATKDGYDVPSRRHIDDPLGIYLVNSQTGPIVLRLEPQASIFGVLRDHSGKPITGNAIIALHHLSDWAGWPRLEYAGFGEFDADSTYHLRALRPGRYFLVADPPVNRQGPEHNAQGQAVGEVPVRYPAATDQSSPFFTLRAGESLHIDLQLPQKTLHRVTGTVEEDQPYSYSFIDTNDSGAYLRKGSPFEKAFEVWLPKGSFRLSTGRDDVTGPSSIEVADSDLSNLSFSIAPTAERIISCVSMPCLGACVRVSQRKISAPVVRRLRRGRRRHRPVREIRFRVSTIARQGFTGSRQL
jgi:carboxypeptidase family protein